MTSAMRRLLTRRFTVDAAPATAWLHVASAEQWPSWARHIRRVTLDPPGVVGPNTSAVIVLTNRAEAHVAVTEFESGHRFRWEGRFLWLGLGYDHTVEPADAGSRITFTVDGDGAGVASIGRLFAHMYARNLDRAIPRLQRRLGPDRADIATGATGPDD